MKINKKNKSIEKVENKNRVYYLDQETYNMVASLLDGALRFSGVKALPAVNTLSRRFRPVQVPGKDKNNES